MADLAETGTNPPHKKKGSRTAMPIRFAAPPEACSTRLSRRDARAACGLPANDNGTHRPRDVMLHAALRHFAEHGLAAAMSARQQAEAAHKAGNREECLWWLEICRALDRRMAGDLDARIRIGS